MSGVCAQVGNDSYCTPACPNGNECSSDRTCTQASLASGQTATVCALTSGYSCSLMPSGDAGGPGPNDSSVPLGDGGGPVTGSVGPNGGSLSRLLFAVVGDTRPGTRDDTPGYPTAIIQKIFSDVQNLNPRPPFMLATGDYQYASSWSGSAADQQFGIYMQARSTFSGTFFPTMGNHECTGSITSDCGQGNPDGLTLNYNAFMSKALGPIQKSLPYYAINVNDLANKWTAKFVFVAANAWSNAEQSWLQQTLATPTTYTFIVRHEPHDVVATGVAPSEQIMAQYPYTLCIVGHSHSYFHFPGREVLIGNGGAPLSGNKNYGYGLFNQRPDGAIVVDMVDYQSGLTDGYFHFVVKPDGTPTK